MTSFKEWKLSEILSNGPLPTDAFIRMSIELTSMIQHIHQHNETIGKLSPSMIAVSSSPLKIRFTENVTQNHAYLSPEQSNLLCGNLDQRSDLYALGVIFYEMLTGRLPYEPLDREDWQYAHLVHKPTPFRDAAPRLQEPLLEKIIGKLLEKDPEERYQTAYGLLMDLKLAPSHPFELGKYDRVSLFRYPSHLYGRNSEIEVLEAEFRRAVQGEYIHINIEGAKGTGKTSLARWLERRVTEHGGIFIQANVKQERRDLSERSIEEIMRALHRGMAQSSSLITIFLDDVQWLEPDSFARIKRLAIENAEGGMMLISTFCSKDTHDDCLLSEHMESAKRIVLGNLQYEDVRQLITEVVNDDSPRVHTLTRAAYYSSAGHPERLYRLLEGWNRDKKLYYDTYKHQWVWDEELIDQMDDPTQALQLFEERFLTFGDRTKQMLAVASVIGKLFSLSLLAEIYECQMTEAQHHLELAEHQGMISRDDRPLLAARGEITYAFVYATFQQYLYRTLEGEQDKWHLKIGYALHSQMSAEESSVMFAATHHLNKGSSRMTHSERRELAKLNDLAGETTVRLERYREAKEFYDQGLNLIYTGEGEPDELACRLMLQYAACLYYCGEIKQSKAQYMRLFPYAHKLNDKDRSFLTISQINMNALIDNEQAVQHGREALAHYGWIVPNAVSKTKLLMEVIRTQHALRKARNQLRKMPFVENNDAFTASSEILLGMSFPWLLCDPVTCLTTIARFIRHGLTIGLNDSMISLICLYEMIIQRTIPNLYDHIRTGIMEPLYEVSDVSSMQQSRLLFFLGLFKQLEYPWESAQSLEKAMRRSVEGSDAITANFIMVACIVTHNGSVQDLVRLLSYMRKETLTIADGKSIALQSEAKQYSDALQDESALNRYIDINQPSVTVEIDNYGCICRLEAAYLTGRLTEALYWAESARKLEFPLDWVQCRKLRIYEALSLAGLAQDYNRKDGQVIAKKLERLCRKMTRWTGIYGQGSAMYSLICAERYRLIGRTGAAIQAYETAITKAKEEGHGLSAAIANERLSRLYEKIGISTGAIISIMNACITYSDWGVLAKVNQLKGKYPELRRMIADADDAHDSHRIQPNEPENKKQHSPRTEQHGLQIDGFVLDQITNWIVEGNTLDRVQNFLVSVCRQVGADGGLFIEAEMDGFRVLGAHDVNGSYENERCYAEAIVRSVYAFGHPILVKHAATSRFAKDPYIERHKPRSILCMPVHIPAYEHLYILYLENKHIAGIFSDRSVSILELMVSRMVYLSSLNHNSMKSQGNMRLSESSAAMMPRMVESLTVREVEVLIALSEGLSNKEIGERLSITEATVKRHISNVYGKLQVKRRGQAISRAKEMGLI